MGSRPPDSKCFLLPHPTCWSQADSVHTSLPRPRGSTATISIGSTTLTKPTLSHLPGQLSTRFQPDQGKEVGDRRGPKEACTGTLGWGGHSWELQERNAAGDDEIWAWTRAEWIGDTHLGNDFRGHQDEGGGSAPYFLAWDPGEWVQEWAKFWSSDVNS